MSDKFPARKELRREYDQFFTDNPGKWATAARNEFAIQAVKDLPFDNVLDVGCGNGHTLAAFGQAFPEALLFGLDISPVACELAAKNSGAHVESAFVEDYRPDAPFDLILCMGVAEHFKDPLRGLKAVRKIAAGHLYLEVPHNLAYSPGEQNYRRLSVGSHQLEWHWPRSKWEEVIEAAGFEIAKSLTGKKPAWEFVWVLK
jgi:SAM-dependent methyltransferase